MTHASLFSGIGGFDLAASWEGIETLVQIENDEWCLKVLEKNFPNARRFKDIRKFNGKPYRDKIDILTGGFPCQPFSVAGKRKGKKDFRFLWPEMLRVISEIRPRFVIGENVPGIIGLALDKVLADLETLGYSTETFVIPACAKNAPHRRDRVWIIAHTHGIGAQIQNKRKQSTKQISFGNSTPGSTCFKTTEWTAKPRMGRVVDGLPHRVDRIRGLGNAIVPQVAQEIFRLLRNMVNRNDQTLNGMKASTYQIGEVLTNEELFESSHTTRRFKVKAVYAPKHFEVQGVKGNGKKFLHLRMTCKVGKKTIEILHTNYSVTAQCNGADLQKLSHQISELSQVTLIEAIDGFNYLTQEIFLEPILLLEKIVADRLLTNEQSKYPLWLKAKYIIDAPYNKFTFYPIKYKGRTWYLLSDNRNGWRKNISILDKDYNRVKENVSVYRGWLELPDSRKKILIDNLFKKKDDTLKGITSTELPKGYEEFVREVQIDIISQITRNKSYYERLAHTFGIRDQNLAKELTELAITREARTIAHMEGVSIADKFQGLVELYEAQVNLSHRTSQSVLLQQYSTPAPISYLAGVFAGAYSSISIFEPCAGNGLLTIAARPEYTTVNEIDAVRLQNLKSQGYNKVLSQDAGKHFKGFENAFESVLTNPPFGKLDEVVNFGTFGIKTLEHMMVIHALNCMKDNGRASVIVGGHATYDDKGRIRKGANRIFLNYLYQHYHVVDVININGKKLYSRQGTGFDVRMILIDGRKARAEGHAPLYNSQREKPVSEFQSLYERVAIAHLNTAKPYEMEPDEFVELNKKIYSLVPPRNGNWKERIEQFRQQHAELIEEHFHRGYFIEKRVRKHYPEIFNDMRDDDDDFDMDVQDILRQQELAKHNRKPLSGSPKEQLYLMRFIDEKTGMEYEAWAPLYSMQQAQRFAQNVVADIEKNYLGHKFTVQWVRPWIEKHQLNGPLGAPYLPTSEGCVVLDTVVPDSMSFETHEALRQVKDAVGGDIDEFVRNRLGYPSKLTLCSALAAEQIDAVALAIYNIEARKIGPHGQGMVIGDQTGIGKGRIAAALIRYGVKRGYKPIFLTEKPNLFTDIYRDLKAIGSAHLVPFIINARDEKSNVLDEHGDIMYSALTPKEQDAIFEQETLPSVYDFIMATYTQFNSPKKPKKRNFLLKLAVNNILNLDEAHNASGSGNTGQFLQEVVANTNGVLFLSATFAKRPDNMPLYAMKTVLQESNMDKTELVNAITRGGVALQEIIASELVKEGQMLRRERSSEGVEVNYITLTDEEVKHREIADAVTEILRDIIQFQKEYVLKEVAAIDDELSKSQKQAQVREGTQRAGADAMPYFSKVFQVINQMLFAIKAESVAERAIMRLREGKKPVIAFSSTMGAFVEDVENIEGGAAREGDIINADFSEVLRRGLEGINRYSVVDSDGQQTKEEIDINKLGAGAQRAYQLITNKIERISTGITVSPIDVIVQRIREAGYTVAEVTGRKYELELFEETPLRGLGELQPEKKGPFPVNIQNMIKSSGRFGPGKQLLGRIKLRKRMVTNEAFRRFNNNEIDVLLINQSGSTGASAHAIPTDKVQPSEVKQRVIIILQAELDISTEVQKRGRINRTGQIHKPIYDYVTSAIPAEQRLMMMLQSKLKSLDANTSSNQKQSKSILDVADFLNKYGDKLVADYLDENPEIDDLLDNPLDTETYSVQEPALKVSGRVAVLPTKEQQEFYEDMTGRYNDYVELLKQSGEYDLEVERLELNAKLISEEPVIMGKGGTSTFGTDSILEEVEVDVLRKPLTVDELLDAIKKETNGKTATDIQFSILDRYEQYAQTESKHLQEIAAVEQYYDEAIRNLPEEKALKKVLESEGQTAYEEKLIKDTKKYEQIREEKIKKIFDKQADANNYLKRIFQFFYIGRPFTYVQRYDDKGEKTEEFPAVFLGLTIDYRKRNPYAFSNVKLRFAVANGMRMISIPASNRVDVNLIFGASKMWDVTIVIADYWQKAISQKMKNREIRHIVTGNILQGLGKFSNGRLISYTTSDGTDKKGILLPMNWEDAEQETGRQYTVPATKVFPIIRSLAEGHEMTIGKNISIFRVGGRFKLMVPASRSAGGDIYLNENVLALVEGNNFNKVSNEMVAIFDNRNLERMLFVLENEVGTSVTVSRTQFKYIKEKFPQALQVNNFPKLEMLPEEAETETADDDELVLEAEALTILQELELSVRRKRMQQQQ